MWADNPRYHMLVGRDYATRFQAFREFEGEHFRPTHVVAQQAWALLPDLESTFAARAYFACLCVACAMIEIQIREATGDKRKPLRTLVSKLGLANDVGWLIKLRNDVMHGNQNQFVNYVLNDDQQRALDATCMQAFKLVHGLPAQLEASLRRNTGS